MTMRRAHETYAEEMKKKDDGRPDFAARKACNYLEDAIEVIEQSIGAFSQYMMMTIHHCKQGKFFLKHIM